MAKILVNQPEKPVKQDRDFTAALVLPDGRRVRRAIPLNDKQRIKTLTWEIDRRFVKEVEYLERSGRVDKRAKLELACGLEVGAIASIRAGLRGVAPANIVRLFQLYRGDRDFIELGSRNPDLHKPFIPGTGRLDIYEPYYHRYTTTARFRIGPTPETITPHPTGADLKYSAYWPADPDNLEWTPPPRMSIMDFMGKKGAEAAPDDKDDE